MKKYALIENGVVSSFYDNTTGQAMGELFHESLVWALVPNGVQVGQGDFYDGVKFSKASASPPAPRTQFSVRDYIKRFTLDEQVTIRQAQFTDMEVGLVYDDFNRAEFIDVTDPDVEAGIDLYIDKGLLDPGRKAELLAPDAAQP